VKLQTWFPFRIQVYVNGHEWLARQMEHEGVEYAKLDNAFLRLSDAEKAQKLADGFERVDWVHVLDRYAMRVNPLFGPETVINNPEEFRVRRRRRATSGTWMP